MVVKNYDGLIKDSLENVLCFHCTPYANLSSVLDKGLNSVYHLVEVEGLTPRKDFECKSGGGGKYYKSQRRGYGKPIHNGICFSYGGIWSEAEGQYFDDILPVSFGFKLDKLLKNHAVGVNSNNDLEVTNKEYTKPTKIELDEAEVMFFPDDIYFKDNKPIKIIGDPRISLETSVSYLKETKKYVERNLKEFQEMKEAAKQTNRLDEVKKTVYEAYVKTIDNLKEDGKKETLKNNLDTRKEYMEFDSISGLKTLNKSEITEILYTLKEELQSSGSTTSDEILSLDYQLRNIETNRIDYINKVFSKENVHSEEIAELLLRRSPGYVTCRGYVPEENNVWMKYYEEHRESIDILVDELNKDIQGPYGRFNANEINTSSGRILYQPSGIMMQYVKARENWENYKETCEEEGNLNSKDFLREQLKEKGAEIKENENLWEIINYKELHLPPKIIFFGNGGDDLGNIVNKYLTEHNKFNFRTSYVSDMERIIISEIIEEHLEEGFEFVGKTISPCNVQTTLYQDNQLELN